ncbi:hypothetical protein L873DRAFT_1721697, partial [Choiromyces venosus 120613-1]
ITLYKEPIVRQLSYARLNHIYSSTRIRMEHAFRILKVYWRSLHYGLSSYIGHNIDGDHK